MRKSTFVTQDSRSTPVYRGSEAEAGEGFCRVGSRSAGNGPGGSVTVSVTVPVSQVLRFPRFLRFSVSQVARVSESECFVPVCTARTWGPGDLRVLVIASSVGRKCQPRYPSLRYGHTLHHDGDIRLHNLLRGKRIAHTLHPSLQGRLPFLMRTISINLRQVRASEANPTDGHSSIDIVSEDPGPVAHSMTRGT